MSKSTSPTKQRQSTIFELVTDTVYKLKGLKYSDEINPFKVGTSDFNRFKNRYLKTSYTYHAMETQFQGVKEVYGG